MLRANKILGLAVGQRSILVAEVVARSGRPTVTHCAEFSFPEGLTPNDTDKMGAAFAQFLRGRKFSTRDAVIGLPAKRLVTRRKEVPPAAPAVAASALRLQAEGEFSAEFDDLVLDFAGHTSTSEASTVLLMATPRAGLDQYVAIAKAAGMRVTGITSTTAALGRASSRMPGGDSLVLNLSPGSAELALQHGADTAFLRHLNETDNTAPESLGALAGEIRRTVAALPQNGRPMTLALWNTALSDDPGDLLRERLNMPVTTAELRSVVVADSPDADRFAPAVAVALSALEPAGLQVDFLHSRLAPPREAGRRGPILIGSAVGLVALGIIVGAWSVSTSKDRELAYYQHQNATMAAQTRMAQTRKDDLETAQIWIANQPLYVACWRDLTSLFPAQGNSVWATSLAKGRDTWELNCKCVNESFAQDMRNRMLVDRRFAEPQLKNIQEDRTSHLVTFTLYFKYVGSE